MVDVLVEASVPDTWALALAKVCGSPSDKVVSELALIAADGTLLVGLPALFKVELNRLLPKGLLPFQSLDENMLLPTGPLLFRVEDEELLSLAGTALPKSPPV